MSASPASPSPDLARIVPPREPLRPMRLLRALVRNPIESFPQGVYEEPVFRTHFLGRETVFVSDPDLIQEVLLDKADAFAKSVSMRRALKPALGSAILTAEGAHWRWQRRTAAPIFRHERIADFAPAMLSAARERRRQWQSLPEGATIDVAHEMMRTTFDIIVDTMLSGRSGIDADRVERGVTEYLESTGWQLVLALLKAPAWTPFPGKRRANIARGYLKSELRRIIGERRAAGALRRDLVGLLLEARDSETGHGMDDQEVVDNLLTFISAGHETTALALAWTFYLLSLHPGAEAKVLAEIASVTGGSDLSEAHIGQLIYTRQALMEAMRLYPPAPVIGRTAVRDVKIGNEAIARGAATYVPIYAVHRHKLLWPVPDRFDPDRFESGAMASRPRFAYLPFGGGPRICIGMHFAMVEAIAILATLLPAMRLVLPLGHKPELRMRINATAR